MNIEKKELSTIQNNSLFYLSEPSAFARKFLYYVIGIGHFYATERYLEMRTANAYDSFLLMYVFDGMLQIETNGQKYEAPSRSLVLIDCYKPHSYKALTPTEFVYLHFDGNNSRLFFEELMHQREPVFFDDCFNAHYRDILRLCNDINRNIMPSEGAISVFIHKILCELCKTSNSKYESKYSPAILKTLNFIENNFTKEISIGEMARLCNFSPSHFSRLFRKETGVAPYSYILDRRMGFACELLLFSDYSIKQIAEKTGYSSDFNFMNKFKKKFGVSPCEYRRSRR